MTCRMKMSKEIHRIVKIVERNLSAAVPSVNHRAIDDIGHLRFKNAVQEDGTSV